MSSDASVYEKLSHLDLLILVCSFSRLSFYPCYFMAWLSSFEIFRYNTLSVNSNYYYMAGSASGQDEANPVF